MEETQSHFAESLLSTEEPRTADYSSPEEPSARNHEYAPLLNQPKALVPMSSTQNGMDDDDDSSPCSAASMGEGLLNRDLVLAKLNHDRIISVIKAWEENIKTKSLNRYNKKLAKIAAWEKAKKAKATAELRTLEEKMEKRRAACVERTQNEIALIHMKAEEDRALAQALHGEETLRAEEEAMRYRAFGQLPKKSNFCFRQ